MTRGVGTPDISGEKMREFLENGDLISFAASLPPAVDAKAIFDILRGDIFREYVQAVVFRG